MEASPPASPFTPSTNGSASLMDADGLQTLLEALRAEGYQVIAPTVRDDAIVYAEVEAEDQLPQGWMDEQDGGRYRLQRRDDAAYFGYTVGVPGWKAFLNPPRRRLWQSTRSPDGELLIEDEDEAPPRQAFVGMRACELAALAIQDQVFMRGPAVDPVYAARRAQTFIVAVNCGQAAATCFCTSMGTGPQVTAGFDLALTELLDADRHDFLVESGTPEGLAMLDQLPLRPATKADVAAARQVVADTAAAITRHMDTEDVHDLLLSQPDHPRWDDVAQRCLACGNCTMVCPTCFCTTVEDTTDLTGQHAERWQTWDSCFSLSFSYLHGGSVRRSTKARYRQWLTHKMATWVDQFGTFGCVGCGRCITWCPVGIDLTQEVEALCSSPAAHARDAHPHDAKDVR